MKGLDEIIAENKRADANKTKPEIKLSGNITVKAGDTDGVIYITNGKTTIGLTQTVLKKMIEQNCSGDDFSTNGKILHFLQDL